jgi:hypothetical protein
MYASQTGRMYKDRYREHIQAIRNISETSKFAQQILETGHTYGTIEETMEIMQLNKKGHLLNTLEHFYIFKS